MQEKRNHSDAGSRKRRILAVMLLIVAFLLLSIASPILDSKLRAIQFSLQEGQFAFMQSQFDNIKGHLEVDLSNLIISIGPRNDSLTDYGINLLRKRAKESFFNSVCALYVSYFNDLPSDSMLASWQATDYISLAEKKVLPVEFPPHERYGHGLRKLQAVGDARIYRETAGEKADAWITLKYFIFILSFICQGLGMYLLNIPYIDSKKDD